MAGEVSGAEAGAGPGVAGQGDGEYPPFVKLGTSRFDQVSITGA